MLNVTCEQIAGFCDGLTRRSLLRLGGLGFGSLALPNLLQLRA